MTSTGKRKARRTKTPDGRQISPDHAPVTHNPDTDDLPMYCDYSCPKADFPPADAVGACRREQAVWCTLLEEFNNKNGKCKARGG